MTLDEFFGIAKTMLDQINDRIPKYIDYCINQIEVKVAKQIQDISTVSKACEASIVKVIPLDNRNQNFQKNK